MMTIDFTMIIKITAAVSGALAFYYYLTGDHLWKTIIKYYNEKSCYRRNEPKISDFFKTIKSKKISYVVYQFGLRPHLPLIDTLYLEFLHNLLKNDGLENIVIFPSIDLSASLQDENALRLFKQNINKIFIDYEDRIVFCDPFNSNYSINNNDFTTPEFLETINYIGSEKFFDYLQSEWKTKIRNISDFNMYHPANSKLLVLITHLIGAWQVIKYIKQNIVNQNKYGDKLELGFMFWETEVDKLGVYKKFAEENKNVKLSVLLGKTTFDKNKVPVPVFDPKNTINVFQKLTDNFVKINNCSKHVLIQCITIVEAILKDNYGYNETRHKVIDEGKSVYEQEIKSGNVSRINLMYPDHFYTLISLLNELMKKYNNGCNS